MVLHIAVDESNTCLELSVDRSLVRTVSLRAERPNMDKAHVGQNIKAQVLLIKDDFVLVTLKQHAAGTLAFLPRRQVRLMTMYTSAVHAFSDLILKAVTENLF